MNQTNLQKQGFIKYQNDLDSILNQLEQNQIVDRIQKHDHTVWQSDPTEITNRLGWLDIARRSHTEIENLKKLLNELKEEGYTQAVLLGMGGSSLAPDLFAKTFGHTGGLDLRILDSTDPDMVLACRDWVDPGKTVFIVSSKSGGTAETFSLFKYFYTWIKQEKEDNAGRHFIVITDPGSMLEQISKDLNFRKTFINDPNIGGRFSALSFFGLVPAALLNMNLEHLLTSAINADWKTALELGAIMGYLATRGRNKLTFIMSPELNPFGDWVEQLIAESTGKQGKGILPVLGEKLLPPDCYAADRLFVHLKFSSDQQMAPELSAIAQAGHPVITLNLENLDKLGEQFFIWELATAISGHILKINPFNQPNVESAKAAAKKMISEYQKKGILPEPVTAVLERKSFKDFLSQSKPGDYISVQAFIPMNSDTQIWLHQIQSALLKATSLPVTIGFGPRFLHSTGQLHKGDSGNGLFIQLTCDPSQDIPIPNEPGSPESDMSFYVLKSAQAMGDYQALQDAGRRVIHFHLNKNLEDIVPLIIDANRGN